MEATRTATRVFSRGLVRILVRRPGATCFRDQQPVSLCVGEIVALAAGLAASRMARRERDAAPGLSMKSGHPARIVALVACHSSRRELGAPASEGLARVSKLDLRLANRWIPLTTAARRMPSPIKDSRG